MARTAAVQIVGLVLVGIALAGFGGTGTGNALKLTTSLRNGMVVRPGQIVEFTVAATLPYPAAVRLALLNPPTGCIFSQDASRAQPSSGNVVKGKGRWLVPSNVGGFHRLTFRATIQSGAAPTVFTRVDLRVDGVSTNSPILVGDVTGDAVLDMVAGATLANNGFVRDTGAVYVWNGTANPSGVPDAKLLVTGAAAYNSLGLVSGEGIQLADVTGDGVLDVVAGTYLANASGIVDVGTIYVWEGGSSLSGSPAPRATLTVPGAVASDKLGYSGGQGIQLADVTGDGVLDVVASAIEADVAGVTDAGAIYVWGGGSALSGSPPPLATLTVSGASVGDRLGEAYLSGQGIQFADVTGDGVLDVVAGATGADVAGVTNAGAIYVWKGGSSLSGSPMLLATLTVSVASDALGTGTGQGIQLADVTGDGVLDVVAGTPYADVAGVIDVGAIYVWNGGSTLSGTPAPVATLTVPGAVAGDGLGWASGQGIQFADVTGDGVLDVVAGAGGADLSGVMDVGAIYAWKGGATLIGSLAPLATLTVPGAVIGDLLGVMGFSIPSAQGIHLADVTGDGVLDVVAGAFVADVAGVIDAGAIYVWKGGSTLSGSLAPLASLTVPGAVAYDAVGGYAVGQGIQIADMTGDGVFDVVAGARNADVAGVRDVGAIYVWRGGSTLSGSPLPRATLTVSGAVIGDYLGSANGQGIELVDVTGDGVLDVVAGAAGADISGVRDVGAIYVWKGGPALSGSPTLLATLTVSGAVAYDNLGLVIGQGLQLADVTGDGVLDVVTGTSYADIAGKVDVGAIYVWSGGSILTGSPVLWATLTVSGAVVNDLLGGAGGQGVHLADVTGDGVLDVVAGASSADIAGKTDTGAIYVWEGGSACNGSPPMLSTLTVPGAKPYDQVGS